MIDAVCRAQPANCHACRHYLVTWDQRFPYGCRAHGFKSKKSPALEVYEASGFPCQLFLPKTGKPAQAALRSSGNQEA
jgi:hypothetical protein